MAKVIDKGWSKPGDEIPQPVGVVLGGNLRPSSMPQTASDHQRGSDPLPALMRRYNIPLTRQNYLELAYTGDVPDPAWRRG
jgi:hypothetical protein